MSGSSKKVAFVGIIFLLAVMMFAAVGIGSGGDTANTDLTSSLLSEKVEKYRAHVTKRAEVYDMQDPLCNGSGISWRRSGSYASCRGSF